jgi:large subunit ribosomal protein L14e
MFKIGRVCVKTAGRDAGGYCIIIEEIDTNYVLVDGQTRRRKVNIDHLEPTEKTVKIKKSADNKTVVTELKKVGINALVRKTKPKKSSERPKKAKAKKSKPELKKADKPANKSAEPKEDKPKSDAKAEKPAKEEKKPAKKAAKKPAEKSRAKPAKKE